MATSKSAKGKWTAGALLYSGRRDPVWEIPGRLARQLLQIWEESEGRTGATPAPPVLGYRGVFLRDAEDREWHAFGGVISMIAGSSKETRQDTGRKLERTLLDSAPAGVLPKGLLP